MVLIAYAQMSQINAATDVNSKARDPNVGMRLHLLSRFPVCEQYRNLKVYEVHVGQNFMKTDRLDRRESLQMI